MKSLKALVFCTSIYFVGCTDMDFAIIPGSEALRVKGGVQIQSPAPMTANKVGVFVEGSCTSGFKVELIGVGNGAVTEPNLDCKDGLFSANVKFSNGDGVKNVVARQNLDVNGNGAWAQDARDFLKDTTPPAISITTPIPNSELKGNITIGGYCEPGLNVSLSLATGGSIGTIICSAGVFSLPYTLSGADGVKNIVASQTDVAGNTGSDNKNIIKDTIAPVVAITLPAVNAFGRSGIRVSGTCETGYIVALSGVGMMAAQTTPCTSGTFAADVNYSNGDGTKKIAATQTDKAGNSGSSNRDFMRDSTAPIVKITSPAAGTATRGLISVSGTCESGLPITISGSALGASTQNVSCASGQFAFNLTPVAPDGMKQIVAAQTDAAGNTGNDQTTIELDMTAPRVTITAPAENYPAVLGVTVSGTCETGLEVVVNGTGVVGTVRGVCTNSSYGIAVTFSNGDGTKNVVVSQTDKVGNIGSATRNFVRDSTAPAIAITSPAPNFEAQTGVRLQGNCETGINVDISGSGVAGSSMTTCTAGKFDTNITFSPGDGVKMVIASQRDGVGNVTQDQRNFIKDTTAPIVKITAPADGSYVKSQITLVGTCESGVTVVISGTGLTSSVNSACTGGAFSQLLTLSAGDGTKAITASQTDNAGNQGSDSKSYNKDTTGPAIAITAPAANTVAVSGVRIQGTCEPGFAISLSGAGLASPNSAICSAGLFAVDILFTIGDGVKNIIASQTDANGNVGSDNRNFVSDTIAPVVKILAPAALSIVRNGFVLSGSCESGFNVMISGAGVASNSSVVCAGNVFSTSINLSAGDGVKNVVVTQTDAVGNSGSDNRDFALDSMAPVVIIALPVANSYLGTNFTVSGACESGVTVVLTGGISSVNTACTGGGFSVAVTATSGDGVKTVTARQTDSAGNIGSDSKSYNIDTTAPVVRITAPAANINGQSGVELRGTCETGLEVVISGAGVEGTVRTPCTGAAFTQNISFSIGEGPKVVSVSQTDSVGNTGTDNRTFQKDVSAPAIAFTLPAEGSVLKAVSVNVQGTCETGLVVNLMGSGLATASTTACSAGRFSANVNLSAGDGDKNIIGYQTDAAGNNGSAVLNLVLDMTAPVVRITSPAAGSSYSSSVTITGTCETGLDVVAGGSGSAGSVTASCTGGSFSTTVNLSSGDGAKNITVSQTDRAGNVGSDSRSFDRLSSTPVIKITAPASGTRAATGLTLQGTCQTGLTVNISGDVSSPASTTCTSGTFSVAIVFSGVDGMKTVAVAQTNAVGNTGTDQRDFVKGVVNGYDVFNVTLSNPRVDILFVDDNSSSMEKDQLKLGQKFSSFISGLNGVDWQIGVTTTDCSTGPYGICGSLMPLTGSSGKILSPGTANYEKVFLDTVYRPETVGCQARGDCPSSNEQPLFASMTAMDKRSSDNAGFFRSESDLAVIVLSDEDEKSNSPASATQAPTAQSHFKSIWPSGKKLSVYGIIIQPGDSACLNAQTADSGGFAFEGNIIDQWVALSGGISGSICDADYSSNLQNIGRQVRNIADSVELSKTPIASTVRVVFTPSQAITWTVQGNRVLFSAPPPVGTRIEVYYDSP